MLFETEIKVKIKDNVSFEEIISKCRLNAQWVGDSIFQRDEYYDTKEELLKKLDMTVRLRIVNTKIKVALKGPRQFTNKKMHKRIELEFTVFNENEIRTQISENELFATAIIEKRRWPFKIQNCEVVVDQLPFIGAFLEVEGDSAVSIDNILNILNLSQEDAVRENYMPIPVKSATQSMRSRPPNPAESGHSFRSFRPLCRSVATQYFLSLPSFVLLCQVSIQFPHRPSFQMYLMSVMDQSIQNSISQGRVADLFMPMLHWELAGNQN